MPISTLKHKLEIMQLEQKFELDRLKLKHEAERKELLSKCNHQYDNGVSAQTMKGDQRDFWYACDICGITLR